MDPSSRDELKHLIDSTLQRDDVYAQIRTALLTNGSSDVKGWTDGSNSKVVTDLLDSLASCVQEGTNQKEKCHLNSKSSLISLSLKIEKAYEFEILEKEDMDLIQEYRLHLIWNSQRYSSSSVQSCVVEPNFKDIWCLPLEKLENENEITAMKRWCTQGPLKLMLTQETTQRVCQKLGEIFFKLYLLDVLWRRSRSSYL